MRTRAQESSSAIERLYTSMRHIFNRGFYKPMGVSGETLREALLQLSPEIYGTIAEEKVELEGLLYVTERLPLGIEECSIINLTSNEGLNKGHFTPIIPLKRRRNCYRIDEEQMNIEITRGRSEIYDILTHLTFLFIESHKISKRILINEAGETTRDWRKLEEAQKLKNKLPNREKELAISRIANIIGRTYEEVHLIYASFSTKENPNRFLNFIYWLGKRALSEALKNEKRVVLFNPVLRERIGHHLHGETWATKIKNTLVDLNFSQRPIHIISANMHSVMNVFYAHKALGDKNYGELSVYEMLSSPENENQRNKVNQFALKNGMTFIKDQSGTNIDVQIFDVSKTIEGNKDIIIVMDYAFGEQAYETLDELLKPIENKNGKESFLNLQSISIMGKAGILEGNKGDIMIPTAHIFEGTADNYPFKNSLSLSDFEDESIKTCEGSMITVLGTSLQNIDLLLFFKNSSWNVIGLEMEGAHYQKAIQAASKIRRSIKKDIEVRYAYYASDNPLHSGSTLASGGLGLTGVKPTYLITEKILDQIIKN